MALPYLPSPHQTAIAAAKFAACWARRGGDLGVAEARHLHGGEVGAADLATGKPALRVEPRLTSDSVAVVAAAAVAGRGIARVLCYQAADEIARGALRRVLVEHDPPPAPVSLVFQANRRGSPNVRAFAAKAI